MNKRVLVAYATKYGSTKEIAERIYETLLAAGLQADLFNVKMVKDLSPYGAVVLGSAAYYWRWLPEAARFLKKNVKTLKTLPCWLFSSGPTDPGTVAEQMKGWDFPKNLKKAAEMIAPRDNTIFHGVIIVENTTGMMRRIMEKVQQETPFQDNRNWEDITVWAEGIADSLQAA